jgi:molybdopterin molybdotransferase
MIPYEEALAIALRSAPVGAATDVSLVDAVGCVLAEDVTSDTDLPPFNRSAMDGYAVRASDLAEPGVRLKVVGTMAAGDRPGITVSAGEAVRIFTGAAVPEGADTVVMQEETEASAYGTPVLFTRAAKEGANIAVRGEDMREGDVALRAGTEVRASEVSLAAAVGRATLRVHRRPRIAVVSTGDELVAPGSPVVFGQIRDANGPALVARLRRAGFEATHLGIAPDRRADLEPLLERALEFDCAIVSAGVSVGDLDLVPEALADLGVRFDYEKVAMKPGRPTKLGRRGDTAVVGLPGNPSSALIVMEVLFLPMLRKMAGFDEPLRLLPGTLSGRVKKKAGRRLFAPARVEAGSATVVPVECHGSADLVALRNANALLTLPVEVTVAEEGDEVMYHVRTD